MNRIFHKVFSITALVFLANLAALPATDKGSRTLWRFEKNLEGEGVGQCRIHAGNPVFVESADGGWALNPRNTAYVHDAPWLRAGPGFQINCRVRFNEVRNESTWINLAVKGTYGKGEYILRVNQASEGGTFGFFLNTGKWEPRVNSAGPVRAGVWYRVSAGWDGTNAWMEVNGERTQIKRSGEPTVTSDPLVIGPFDGALDDLEIINPAARRSGVACWPFDGTLADATGNGHDASGEGRTFVALPRGGQALQAFPGGVKVAHQEDLTLAPGLCIGCSLLFNEFPKGYAPVLIKDGEYQLRIEKHGEEHLLSFFVFADNRWESRVTNPHNIELGRWIDVMARWDGLRLVLDVNGVREEIDRYGKSGVGTNPLVIGGFNGLIENLSIENPRLPAVTLSAMRCSSVLPRAGRTETISGRVRNFGSAATGCYAELKTPSGVACEGPLRIDFGDMPSGCEREVSWKLRADNSLTANLQFDLGCREGVRFSAGHPLAFFPEAVSGFDYNMDLPATAAAGEEKTNAFYVDAIAGSNTGDGRSPESAWKDFTPINGRTLKAGERLLIRRGSVISQELQVSARGTPDAWVEIGAYGEGPRPVIRRNKDIAERCVLIRNPDYLHIRNLVVCDAAKGLIVYYSEPGHRGLLIEDCIAHHIEGLYRPNAHGIPEWRDRDGPGGDGLRSSAGIGVSGSAGTDIVLRDCEMYQCSWGFFMTGENTVVDRVFCHDNYVRNTCPHPAIVNVRRSRLQRTIFDAAGYHASAGTMGIMLVDTIGFLIRECHFLNQPDSGCHDEGGIDFEARGHDCLVDRCTFRNNAGAAIEVLGLKSPQVRNLEISQSRFFQNNKASKLGPSEIFIWGRSNNREVCCSTGLIRDNGYVVLPGVEFFTNQAPATTEWALDNNRQFNSVAELEQAMPLNNPPVPEAGPELWTNHASVQLAGSVTDDGRTGAPLKIRWEVLEGPGNVAFEDAAAAATRAAFEKAGDYRLRLVADDGSLWRSSHAAVHILPAGTRVTRAWGFEKPLDKEGWSEADLGTRLMKWPDTVSYPVNEPAGGFYVTAMENTQKACLISPDDLKIDTEANGRIVLRLQNHTTSDSMRICFTTADAREWDTSRSKTFKVTANDNQQRLYAVDMNGVTGWTGAIERIRLDFSADGTPVTGTCRLDYIWIGQQ